MDDAEQMLAEGERMLGQEAGARIKAPAEDVRPVTLDELRVVRGANGRVEPIGPVLTPREGTPVCIYPLTLADQLRYRLDVSDDVDVAKLPLPRLHQIVVNHMAEPSFADITPDELKADFGWLTIYDLVHTILVYSRDMFRRPIVRKMREDAEEGGEPEMEGPEGKS